MADVPQTPSQQGSQLADPGQGSSADQTSKINSKPQKQSRKNRAEERRHKALEKAIDKAVSKSGTTPKSPALPPQAPACGSWSPDRRSGSPHPTEAAPLFRALSELDLQDLHQEQPIIPAPSMVLPTRTIPSQGPLAQTSQPIIQLPDSFATMVAEAIKHGVDHCLKQRSAHPEPAAPIPEGRHLSPERDSNFGERDLLYRPNSPDSEDSASEEEASADPALSDDEGLAPDQPSFVGLFKPHMFRSLLFKAQTSTGLGAPSPVQTPKPAGDDSSGVLFAEPTITSDSIPAPKLFLDVVQRQWHLPGSGSNPNSLDKKFYNMASELEQLLQVPAVDPPVVALTASPHLAGPADESLRPEDRRAERTLVKGHQAAAWSVRSSIAASFFNRATLIWLKQLQGRLPSTDVRSHQDLNKIVAAVEFSADATLNSARFASKALGSSVASRRLLWLRHWQADNKNKWRLASAPFSGSNLFGASLDDILVETRDKRKVLPTLSRRGESRHHPYSRPQSFRNYEGGGSSSRFQRSFPSRSGQPRDRQVRSPSSYPNRRSFRGGRGRPFKRSK